MLAGTGGNGGGALVCARRLHGWGASVVVATSKGAEDFNAVPRQQLDIAKRLMPVVEPFEPAAEALECDLVVDGVIGYSLQGDPKGTATRSLRWDQKVDEQGKFRTRNRVCVGQQGISLFRRPPRIVASWMLGILRR